VLVLPTDVAPAKLRLIRAAGAEIVTAGTLLAERLAVAEEIQLLRGFDGVDPYEDADVVTGQGTATAELLAQVTAAGGRLDTVVLPVGGGSAVAGACLATAGTGIEVIGAEPAAVPALSAALRSGAPVTVPAGPTIADGLRPDRIGNLPFSLVRDRIAAIETVSEAEISEALFLALSHAHVLIEPAAATALAVAIRVARTGRFTDVGVLLSGGNVGSRLVASLLDQHAEDATSAR
jgi:threonine dehydratase